jgi:hypothetical protein
VYIYIYNIYIYIYIYICIYVYIIYRERVREKGGEDGKGETYRYVIFVVAQQDLVLQTGCKPGNVALFDGAPEFKLEGPLWRGV